MRILVSRTVLPLLQLSALLLCTVALLPTIAVAANDDRVALVIGNDSYPNDPLKNAANDAQVVARTLSDLGIIVSMHYLIPEKCASANVTITPATRNPQVATRLASDPCERPEIELPDVQPFAIRAP